MPPSLPAGQFQDAVGAASQKPGEFGLAHQQRQAPRVIAIAGEHVEGIELDLIVLAT